MGYAQYVGRVGALAVALGIGVALATGQGMGMARADDSPPADPPSAPTDPSPGTPPADPSGDLNTPTPPSDTPSTSGEPPSAPAPTPSVPDMNFDSSGGAHTSGDDDDTEVATVARVETETPVAPPKPLKKDNSTLAAHQSATAKVKPSHTPPAAGAFDTARPAKSTTTVTVVGESAQVRLAPAANGGPLAATESQQTPTASMMQVSARSAAQPSTASPGIVNVTTRLLATALALFAQPGPGGAPTDPPALLAVLAWARREIQRTLGTGTPDVTPQETTLVVDTVSEPLALTAAATSDSTGTPDVTPQETTLVVDPVSEPLALTAAATSDSTGTIFFGTSPRIGEANGTVMVPIVRTGDLTGPATIEYGITPDTATAGVDYVGGDGTITMDVGVDRVFIPVQILNDNLSEPTETFVVSIINVGSGSTLLFPRTARIDILDDENPVVDPPVPPLTSNYRVTQQVVASGSLNQPLAIKFAPQDPSLMYVAEKGGVIKVFNVDTGAQQSTFIDISSKANSNQDRGLLDIALHPDFGEPVQPGQPEHNYVYAYYVVDPPDTVGNPNANARPDGGGNRFAYLVRFTADAATNYTTVVPGSEVILLGGVAVPGVAGLQPRTLQDISGAGTVDSTSHISQPESGFNAQTGQYVDNYIKVDSRSHAGGSLAFGPDGALYVSIGDGTSFDTTDPRAVSVQNINSLSGKILRIDPVTGLGLPDNPFVAAGDDLSANHSKVYQLGLRNPSSMGFAQDGRLFIANTGWFSWEEIESGPAGSNFGWPYFEGGDNGVLLRAPGYQNLPSAAAFYAAVASGAIPITSAYRAFAHNGLGALVGVDAPYSGSRYPAEFQNDIFFIDVNYGRMFVVDANNRSDVKYLYATQDVPVDFSQGPDGYMYAVNLGANTITRLLIEPILLTPHGSASVANNVFTLTTGYNQAGTAMSTGRIDVRQDFTVAFEVNLGASDGGADGAAIVFHNDPRGANAVGGVGNGLGVGGIQNGLAIEFDTYNNGAGDIAADHTGFRGTNSTFATTPVALPNIENGAWHPVVVTWNAATQTLSYTFDGQPMGTPLTGNIATQFLGGSNFAYYGFGAGTGGLFNTQSVRNINVTATLEGQAPGNNPPIAVADTATTAAGTAVNIAVLANDSDPDNNPLTVTAVSNLVNGTATINGNNTITYTPTAGFSGSGGFTYTISDGTTQRSAPVSVTVTPPPGNSPPIAVADTATTAAGTAVNIAVLANDSDPDNNPLTVTAVSNLVNGTATINGNNTITYTPTAGFSGSGGFTYTISDGTTQRSAPVSVTVTPPPAAVTLTPHGSASVANNVFTLTPGGLNQAGTAMSTGRIDVRQDFTVAFEVNLGASDGGADGAAIVFHNDPRGANAIGGYGVGLGVTGIQNGLAIEFDTYNNGAGDIASDHTGFRGTNSTFATTPVALPNIENGAWHPVVVTWNAATQTLSYTFDGQPMGTPLTGNIATQFLGGSNFAHYGFGAGTGGLSNTQSVRNINVTATLEGQAPGNNPPIAVADTATTAAGTAVNIAVLANDSDPDNNPLTVTAVSNLVNGTATINGNNTITYTPTAGFSGSGGFTYTISDGTTQRSAPVSVTVTPPPGNSPPIAVADTATTAAGTAVNIAVLANDSDPDNNPLTVTAVSNLVNGTATINGNNTITYTPTAGFSGSGGFTYTISDGTTQRSAPVSVTVTPPPAAVTLTPHGSASVANNVFTLTPGGLNQAGTAMSTGRIDVRQDFTVAFEVNLGAVDGGADGAAIVFHNDPRGANAIGGYGVGLGVTGIQNGLAIEFDTYNNGAGDIAADHTGFRGTNSTFATTPVALPNIENGAWHPVVVTWNAATQTLSYTFDGQPMGTPLTGNIATQFLGGSNFAYYGFGAGTGGLSNTQSVRNINVTATLEGQAPGNNPPIAVADTATTAAGTAVNIAVLANDSDPDNNPLTVTAVSNLVNGTATINGNNTITYTPTAGFSGSGGFTYTISDGTTQRSAPVSVTVTPPPGNSPPIAVADTATTAAGTAVNIAVLANDSDPDNNPLTVTAVSNLVNGTATINGNNTITYTPTAGFSGSGGFTYTISDGTTQRSAPVSVTVTPPPAAVTLTPHGSASVANNVFTLTPGGLNQAGTAMSTGRIDVRQDFTVAFEVNLGAVDGGADGAAIVFHNDPRGANAVGGYGVGLGVTGIQNGLAIEFDTYNNGAGDIASDHTGFRGTNSTFATTPVALPNIENGAWHPVVVTWNAATQTLSYTFDGQPMGTPLTGNIATQFLGGSNFAYFGFGAGTGGLSNTQSVRNINVTATLEG